jgi:hypothetical protein
VPVGKIGSIRTHAQERCEVPLRDRHGDNKRMNKHPVTTMIKVSVMYPNTPGAWFDHDYYRTKHMPLVLARVSASCKQHSVDTDIVPVMQISEVVAV